MTLYHTTPRGNVESILRSGLRRPNGKGPIWLHTWHLRYWATQHLAAHKGVDHAEMVRLKVIVRDPQEIGGLVRGRYVVWHDIPKEMVCLWTPGTT